MNRWLLLTVPVSLCQDDDWSPPPLPHHHCSFRRLVSLPLSLFCLLCHVELCSFAVSPSHVANRRCSQHDVWSDHSYTHWQGYTDKQTCCGFTAGIVTLEHANSNLSFVIFSFPSNFVPCLLSDGITVDSCRGQQRTVCRKHVSKLAEEHRPRQRQIHSLPVLVLPARQWSLPSLLPPPPPILTMTTTATIFTLTLTMATTRTMI